MEVVVEARLLRISSRERKTKMKRLLMALALLPLMAAAETVTLKADGLTAHRGCRADGQIRNVG